MESREEVWIRQLVAAICKADSLGEAFGIFKLAGSLLDGWKFVFAAKSGVEPGFAVNRTFSRGASIRSLFRTERVFVLDTDTVREMRTGPATFPIDFSISLDTQAVSYLEPYVARKAAATLPADIKEVFDFIARTDVAVDPIPYLSENVGNLRDQAAADRIYEKLRVYEILRTLDTKWLQSRGEARSLLSEADLTKRAQEHIGRMFADRDNATFMRGLRFRFQFQYCYLLKMVSIQLRSPQASLASKLKAFLEFSDSTMATINDRDTALARAYFMRGQDLTFFGKIQKNKADLFRVLTGMAWDLWHVRQLEEAMTFRPAREARYFFPALLTFDKRLVEVIDLYPLKVCAFKMGESKPLPMFDGDWFELVSSDEHEKTAVRAQFFSNEALAFRDSRRKSVKSLISDIARDLECELSEIARVAPPSR
ncbi:hypothetical protein WS63_06670 [Burkholderia stagnalis]|uniref:hypothetical protein n=1 Tax=Burkholderia stagnalis TaxID=1503054 RepID=UPI00075BBBEC|nr:hypothetical protein [Burkholderia stagnalis]KVD93746.1 hypothetical protein WS63_06670 [Burkholderia stagnalis]